MGITKKSAAFAAALVLAGLTRGGVFAQTFSGSNKLSTDVVEVSKEEKDGDSDTHFAGVTEKISMEYQATKTDFKLVLPVVFDVTDYKGSIKENKNKLYIHFGSGVSGYFDFRPFGGTSHDFVTIVMNYNDTIDTAGSYLPVLDDNVSSGDIGPDVGIVVRPIAGLRIAAGVDIFSSGTWFGVNVADGETKVSPNLHFGADYTYGSLFTVGFALKDIVSDDRQIGVHFKFGGVENLALTAGYTYHADALFDVLSVTNEDGKSASVGGNFGYGEGEHGIHLGASYDLADVAPLTIGFDFGLGLNTAKDALKNTTYKDDSITTLYLGLGLGFDVTEDFAIGLPVQFGTAFGKPISDQKLNVWTLEIAPAVTYTFGAHEFSAGVDVALAANAYKLGFPVYWKYSF